MSAAAVPLPATVGAPPPTPSTNIAFRGSATRAEHCLDRREIGRDRIGEGSALLRFADRIGDQPDRCRDAGGVMRPGHEEERDGGLREHVDGLRRPGILDGEDDGRGERQDAFGRERPHVADLRLLSGAGGKLLVRSTPTTRSSSPSA